MTSCQRTPQPVSPVIAKVGNEVLTMAEINRMTPPNLTAAARKNFQLHYVDNWIKRKVLVQYALEQKITYDSLITQRVENYKEELLIEKLKDLLLTSSIPVSESEIKEYYDKHREEFKIQEDEVHLILLRLESRNIGIEDDIKNEKSLLKVIEKNFLNKPIPDQLEQNGDLGYVPISRLKKPILRAIRRTPIGRISRRIQTRDGIYYIQVLDYKKRGTYRDLVQVKEQIRTRLLFTKLSEKLEEIEKNMWSKLAVDKYTNKLN
jgi:parvulin-like peptidyl-prolyl isomerase